MTKLYKDICSAWISRTSVNIFSYRLTSETSQKYNRSIFILRRTLQLTFRMCVKANSNLMRSFQQDCKDNIMWNVNFALSSINVPYNLVFLFNVGPGFFLCNAGKICAISRKFCNVGALFVATGYYQKTNRFKIKIAVKWFCSVNIDQDFLSAILPGSSWTTLQSFLLLQCYPESIKTILNRIFSCAIFSGASWTTLEPLGQGFYQLNVGQWLTDNFYEENNLCNVALTMLGQHCIWLLSSQYCLNTSKTTLNTTNTCVMLAQGRTDFFFAEK